jgi:predicted DNA binding protein/PAS domain-containing protein
MSMVTVLAHLVVLVGSGVVTSRLAVVAWRRRDRPGASPFVGLMAAASIWSFTYAGGLLVSTEQYRIAFEQLQWFGIAFVPLFLLLFVAEYTGFEGLQRPRNVLALAVVPLLTLAFVLSNPWHHLFWETTALVQQDGLTFAEQRFGAWYQVNLLYTYLLAGGGAFVLLYAIRESGVTFRSRLSLLLVGIAVPFAANLASVLGYQPVAGMDMTPYVFGITGVAFSRAVFDYELFDRTPSVLQIGQLDAFHDLEDAVLVTDGDGEVVLHNQTAADVLGDVDLLDAPVESLLPAVPHPDADLVVDVDDRTYEVSASNVRDASKRALGTTYLLHDVTDREARLRELERNQEVLRTQRERLERQRANLLELDALNGTLRSINQALVNSRTATEIEENVTNQLRTSRLYDDATIAANGAEATTLDVAGPADVDELGSDGDELGSDEDEPGSDVDAAWTPEVVEPGLDDADPGAGDGDSVGRDAGEPLAGGTASSDDGAGTSLPRTLTIPLRFGPTTYGSLRIESRRPAAFDDSEVAVLEELTETVALALSAVETRETLQSDVRVELEYRLTGGSPLAAVTAGTDRVLAVSSTVPRDESTVLAYVDVEVAGDDETSGPADGGATVDVDVDDDAGAVDAVVAHLAATPGVTSAKRVPHRDTVELHVDDRSPLVVAAGRGANVVSAVARDGALSLVVETASGADVRALTEALGEVSDGVDLASKRERAPDAAPATVDVDAVDADLTERQAESLAIAHEAGYFGWPRDSTAEEVSEAMGIASSTLHSHLRKAQGKLVPWYLEERDGDDR